MMITPGTSQITDAINFPADYYASAHYGQGSPTVVKPNDNPFDSRSEIGNSKL